MVINDLYRADIEVILSHRFDNGDDYWMTKDQGIITGSPYSTIESIMYLLELGFDSNSLFMHDCANILFDHWQIDGRFKVYAKGTIYPCQTINVANTLCHMGYANDARIEKTLNYLLKSQQSDGGWRCNKFSYGKGPETQYSNPFPTLMALDAFRYTSHCNNDLALDKAVEFLLQHWLIRQPIGPCHYGIGKLFMQVEYPFRSYNIFVYLYVLSFYKRAVNDYRFMEVFECLQAKLIDGQIVCERVNAKLNKLNFCKKGQTSYLATKRYNEILDNINKLSEK